MKNNLSGAQMKMLEEIKKKPRYLEQISKDLNYAYNYACFELSGLKKIGFVIEEEDRHDKRKKILFLTNESKLFLAKIEARKSAIAKIDSWLDKKFNEIGIDCERLFG